jgi:hypothetical protein
LAWLLIAGLAVQAAAQVSQCAHRAMMRVGRSGARIESRVDDEDS